MEYQSNFSFSDDTSASYLYKTLGSFWTDIFQEKDTIKGYTIGVAEEMIQRYLDLVEVINSYSVKDINVFHREKWKPIVLYKSKINQLPFVFEEGHAVFGAQPELDEYYANAIFQFGRAKTPTAEVYTYYVGNELTAFGVAADRILDPQVVFTYGVDVKIQDKALYFNSNIFDNPNIPKFSLIGENGKIQTFKDKQGNVIEEEGLVLWFYNGQVDVSSLYYNFGYIYNLNFDNDDFFKLLLGSLFNINVNGPTVNALKRCCTSFMGVPVVETDNEAVEWIFSDSVYQYVVTDKNSYKFNLQYGLASGVEEGLVLNSGDQLTSAIEFYNSTSAGPTVVYSGNVSGKGWWLKEGIIDSKLAVSKYLFYGTYTHQLLFSNDLAVISLDSEGNIVFPVEGTEADVTTFHNYINQAANKAGIKTALGLVNPGDTYTIVPVNFLMDNFLRANSAMLKFNFYSEAQRSKFLSILPIIKSQLPPYVYLIIKINMFMDSEEYSALNDCLTIEFTDGEQLLNADGSNISGEIEELAPYGYNDAAGRLFELALSVVKEPGTPLPYDQVVSFDVFDAGEIPDPDAESEGRVIVIKEGGVLKPIPAGVTTAQYGNLLLLDFSN